MSDPSAFPFMTAAYGRVAKWVVTETGDVAKDVFDSMHAGTYGADSYAKAMGRLFIISMEGSLGLVDAAMTAAGLVEGKGPRPIRQVDSATLVVAASDQQRPITVTTPFTRSTPNEAIASALITFQPPILPANQTTFVVSVNATDLPSGLYVGVVRVGPPATGVAVDVEIAL
jgi:hypothetical protein